MRAAGQKLLLLAVCALVVLLVTLVGGGRASGQDLQDGSISSAFPTAGAEAPCAADSAVYGAEAAGQELRHAGLVVVFPDGRTETRCIAFAEEEISGVELLRRSGLPVVFSGFGGLGSGVCRIDDVGCSDPDDCFCQCRGADCAYWSYFALRDGEWDFQNVGPSQRRLRDGDVDGWVWGSGRTAPTGAGSPCSGSAATATPPAVPTPTPRLSTSSSNTGGAQSPAQITEAQSSRNSVASVTPPERTLPAETAGAVDTPGSEQDKPRQAVRPVERAGKERQERDTLAGDASGGGPPAGLVAFGVVAGLLASAAGGLALRRRLGG